MKRYIVFVDTVKSAQKHIGCAVFDRLQISEACIVHRDRDKVQHYLINAILSTREWCALFQSQYTYVFFQFY